MRSENEEPISEEQPLIMEQLGLASRHWAALGISRASDALVIVVSEEKGWISIVLKDRLYPNLGTFALLEKLGEARERSQKQ